MSNLPDLNTSIANHGFVIVESLLPPQAIATLLLSLGDTSHSQRNLLADPFITDLAEIGAIPTLVASLLGAGAFPVRAILSTKSRAPTGRSPGTRTSSFPSERRSRRRGSPAGP
jgi:hypothetical protein